MYSAAADIRRSGRTHATRASDVRTAFGHDRDRILYSTAFRRLAGKAQVVAVQERGLYHTRLTHSLKVAQLSRRLAERLQAEYLRETKRTLSSGTPTPADPDLAEACGLAHDMGHPPFGHVGEEALKNTFDALLAQQVGLQDRPPNDPYYVATVLQNGGFEGNAQSLRVLCYLSARRPIEPGARYGLDLTRAALDGTAKYPALRVHGGVAADKYGAFEPDRAVLEWIRDGHGISPDAPRSFEAELMDWCDDVTYAVHDVMDFFRGGFIPLERLFALTGGPGARTISADAHRFLAEVKKREEAEGKTFDHDHSEEAWLALAQLNDLHEPWQPTLELKAAVQAVTSEFITFFVQGVRYEGEAPCEYAAKFELDADPDQARLKRRACDLLKVLLWVYVIDRPALATVQHGQSSIVSELMSIFSSDEALLPADRREDLDRGEVDLLRAACDHVASLTESDAISLHERLAGTNLGAITDALQ